MKKYLILVFALSLCLTLLAACDKSPAKDPETTPNEEVTSMDPPTEPTTDAPTEAPTDAPTEAPTDGATEEPTEPPTEEVTRDPAAAPRIPAAAARKKEKEP